MDSIYVLIPVTLLLLGLALAAWLWSVGSGQYEDLDKAARSILFDDDPPSDVKPDAREQGPEDSQDGKSP